MGVEKEEIPDSSVLKNADFSTCVQLNDNLRKRFKKYLNVSKLRKYQFVDKLGSFSTVDDIQFHLLVEGKDIKSSDIPKDKGKPIKGKNIKVFMD